jgi:hypothetical protein
MKKLFLSFSLLFIGILSRAQITKGTILLGGDFGFETSSNKMTTDGTNPVVPPTTTKNSQFSLYPSIGKAVKDNLVIGVNLGLGYSTQSGNPNYKENDYGLSVFMRNYKYLGSRFYFFIETGLGFSYSDYTQDDSTGYPSHEDSKSYGIGLALSPGVAYSLSRKWQLEAVFPSVLSAQYSYNKVNYLYLPQGLQPSLPDQHQTGSEFNINSSFASEIFLEVGLRYVIGGK